VDARTVSLGDLWTATGVRPLRTAVAALDPALRDRFDQLLCALTIMITCRAPGTDLVTVVPPGAITVPGYPSTALDDQGGPWPRALAGAAELGADTSAFEDKITGHGLRVPASWLSGGGWTALWARAHR
jgi:hypothetical protein